MNTLLEDARLLEAGAAAEVRVLPPFFDRPGAELLLAPAFFERRVDGVCEPSLASLRSRAGLCKRGTYMA